MGESGHCGFCGRLAPRIEEGFCSQRCRDLAGSGFSSKPHAAGALTPPDRAIEARVICAAPDGVPKERILANRDGEAVVLVRVELDDELARFLDEVDGRLLTLQRFAPGGLRREPVTEGGA